MTPFDLGLLKSCFRSKLTSNEQIDIKKFKKWSRVTCELRAIFQGDFLKILKNSWTRNENFDKFFDPKEPEYNIFGPIPEH